MCLLKSNVSQPRLNCTHTSTVLVSADTRLRATALTRVPLRISMLGYESILTDLFLGSSPLVEDWDHETPLSKRVSSRHLTPQPGMILISFTEGYHLDLSLQLSSHTIYFLHLATYDVHIDSATTQSLGIIGRVYPMFTQVQWTLSRAWVTCVHHSLHVRWHFLS